MVLLNLQVFVKSKQTLTAEDGFYVAVQSSTGLEDAYLVGQSNKWSAYDAGAYVTLDDTTSAADVISVNSGVTFGRGDYVRIMCINSLVGGATADKNRPIATIAATLTIKEVHGD